MSKPNGSKSFPYVSTFVISRSIRLLHFVLLIKLNTLRAPDRLLIECKRINRSVAHNRSFHNNSQTESSDVNPEFKWVSFHAAKVSWESEARRGSDTRDLSREIFFSRFPLFSCNSVNVTLPPGGHTNACSSV